MLGTRAKVDEADRNDETKALVLLDVKNAHNSYSRRKAQTAICEAANEQPDLHQLEVAHTSISRPHTDIYTHDPATHRPTLLTQSSTGGGQGNPLTNIIFPLTINPALKKVERLFPGVEVRAQQDDVSMLGDPNLAFGTNGNNGALQLLETELNRLSLAVAPKKYQV